MKELEKKVALIIGGTSGIGKATANQLLEKGATVHIVGRNVRKVDDAPNLIKHIVDISNESDFVFAERLTKDYKIATIPTSGFNENQEDFKQIRVCFAKTEETLISAAKIINTI